MMKMAKEINIMVTEMEGTILAASINNRMINTTNITGILEDLWYLIQSNIEEQVFQVQRMLADELDRYKRRENIYIDENIKEIQELYISEEQRKKEGIVENEKVILIRPYEELEQSLPTRSLSFIDEEINNLLKYMKFIKAPIQTRLFRPLPYY